MILPNPKDAIHKAMMYRLLIGVLDERILASSLYFKGGTCAAMLGFLDRFSIDLDFDLGREDNKKEIRRTLKKLFISLDFSIKEESKRELFFVLKYDAAESFRNTLKIGIVGRQAKSNEYKPFYLPDITKYAICQTKETMFAHKMVAVTDRYKKYKTIAGRDIYDIHHFFLSGFDFNRKVVEERTGESSSKYIKRLKNFIEKKITNRHLVEDLSTLLRPEKFNAVKNSLKAETLAFLKDAV